MPLFNGSPKRQLAGFMVATIGWILGTMSMGLAEWRVWYVNNTSLLPSGLACVGVWRACSFHHLNGVNRASGCHHYNHHDTYIPLDIRVAQNFLLVASILGLFSKAAIVFALRNVYLRRGQKNTCNPFAVVGMLNIAT
ncbi:claudin-34, partial [Phacochoerus africanus]|uniref:claudin-34 n=1 Tax=Phacochoerus africanus TaxID=41426 RepID=UPI001FD9DF4E